MIKKLLTVAALSFAVCASANAQYITGNKLLEYMNSSNENIKTYAIMYVAGVLDRADDNDEICAPNTATLGQATAIVKKSLESLPEHLHISASLYVFASLKKAWPCKK